MEMEPVRVPGETSEGIWWNQCSPDRSNQDYKKVLRKTSVPVTGLWRFLDGQEPADPVGKLYVYI